MNQEDIEKQNAYLIEHIIYLTDATLATVEKLVTQRNRSKQELLRQMFIAQHCVDVLIAINKTSHGNRAATVIKKYNGIVSCYASAIDINKPRQ